LVKNRTYAKATGKDKRPYKVLLNKIYTESTNYSYNISKQTATKTNRTQVIKLEALRVKTKKKLSTLA